MLTTLTSPIGRVTSARLLVTVLAMSSAVGIGAAGPAGAQYDGTPSLTCRPTSAAPGDSVDCEATGFRSGSDVAFALTGATTTAKAEGAEGKAAATLKVADTAPEGMTKLTATGPAASDGSPLELAAELTITASAVTTESMPDDTATDGTATDATATGSTATDATAATAASSSGSSAPWIWVVLAIVVVAGGATLLVMRQRANADEGGAESDDADGAADHTDDDSDGDGPEPYLRPDA